MADPVRREAPAATAAAQANSAISHPSAPASAVNDQPLLALLAIEAQAREAKNELDLLALIANEARKLTRARQIFVFTAKANTMAVAAVSGLATVDRNAPLIQWIERTVDQLAIETTRSELQEFNLLAFADKSDSIAKSYPLPEALWAPFHRRNGTLFGGMLLTREGPWTERDSIIAKRLAATFAHAWESLLSASPLLKQFKPGRKTLMLSSALAALLTFVPVSLTTLAPVEVAPSKPFVVAAPIDGAIEDIPAEPNSHVKKGQVLIRFTDTTLRNRLDVAEREVMVADARLKTTTQIAFSDVRGKHDMAVSRAELALKTAERDYARDLLAKTVITADRDGFAIFGDKNEMIGRPVAAGERLIEIADPSHVEFRIDVPVADSIILTDRARVKVFLDSDPLHSIDATVVRADYIARTNDGTQLSFRVIAEISPDHSSAPRLGARGTAQIYGAKVPFIFYLMRRPFSTLRQWVGL
jgi:multidrug efflux pump subunit AcrA (membrane-fusion protein)